MLAQILTTTQYTIAFGFISVILLLLTFILKVNKNHRDMMEKKANQEDMKELKDRVEKKADREYLEIFINRLETLERRHEVANTQLRTEFLGTVKELNERFTQIQNQIIGILKKDSNS